MDSKLEALYQPIIALVLVALATILLYKGIAVPEWLVGLAILAISAVFHQQALASVIKSGAGQVDSNALAQQIAPLVAQQLQPVPTAQPIQVELAESPSGARQ